ncbi:MAG: aspartate aminotransferase family protein [Pseudomonadota bacterium]
MSAQDTSSPIFGTFARAPVAFVRGEGVRLFTESGDDYLDFAAGIAVNSLGHCHPRLTEALHKQVDSLWHVSNLYGIPGQEELGQKLIDNTFADKVFFTNSGAEAIECAIKTARRYHWARGDAERVNIITFDGAFHGRTLATIAAGGQEKYLEGFGPKAGGFVQVELDDEDGLSAAIKDPEAAAILIEPIMGEGGIHDVPHHVLKALRAMCDESGLLLIFDEIQTGVGRTGKLFAHEWTGISPDIMAIAKGIGGGFPVGACLATAEACGAMVPGTHGTTFGGNPLAMAVGGAVMDVVTEPGFLDEVASKGLLLKQKLAALVDSHSDRLELVRGQGLMLGLKCKTPNVEIGNAFRDAGVLTVPAGDNTVRLLPPLIVTEDDISEAIEKMDVALSQMPTTKGEEAA